MLKVPATISKITTMCDGGLRLQVDTQEIAPEDAAEVMELRNKLGVFVFAEETINAKDLENLPKVELEEGEKAPSARLRAALYVYWDQHKIAEQFDLFYRRQMEKFITTVKEKLN
ncbi:MAG: hypothetical protein PHQ35_10605 [Phycisphaerae bacterium]|nr:hypothetical protein [Phycisphaerae bacterium]